MFKNRRKVLLFVAVLAIIVAQVSVVWAKEEAAVQISVENLGEGLYMLADSGGMGNTTVLTGADGVLMIDTKIEASVGPLLARIAELSTKPIRFAVITHWHFDHVGGNETVARTGATIVAHENVRKRMGMTHEMKVLGATVPPAPEIARPMLTFTKEIGFHMNGEDVRVFHVQPGHTDGDAVVYFPKANVICTGDLYFEGLYPYIGIYSGGSINSMITVLQQIIPMIDENTKIVPGHGPVSDKARLQQYVAMLTAVRDSVARLLKEGKTMEEAVAAKPTQAFDEKWGHGFLPPDKFAGLVYMDLSPQLP
jgi:cyclase